jgi:hypothetical protein
MPSLAGFDNGMGRKPAQAGLPRHLIEPIANFEILLLLVFSTIPLLTTDTDY